MWSGVIFAPFLFLALNGGVWSASRSGRFTPEEISLGTHWMGGWVGPRSGLNAGEKRKISYACKLNLLNSLNERYMPAVLLQRKQHVKINVSSPRILKRVKHRVRDFKSMTRSLMKRTHRKGREMLKAVINLGPNPRKS
jgi:hypothetical protein